MGLYCQVAANVDSFVFLGITLALAAVLGGNYLEGGDLSQLANGPAALIVFGGSIAASMIQTPRLDFYRAIQLTVICFKKQSYDFSGTLNQLTFFCELAHRNGLLVLERQLPLQDEFSSNGLRLVVDGQAPESIRSSLEIQMIAQENRDYRAAKVLEAMGGYAPTLGIVGAVLGLIHVLGNLAEPEQLGAGIATAFVATVYGVGFANLLFIPLANRIKAQVERRYQYQEMILEALLLIADGKSPHLIRSRLQGYVC